MTGREIDAVLFDLGNVLVRWDPYLPYLGRHDRAAVDAFFEEIDFAGFAGFNHRQDAGRPWAQARAELTRTHPYHVPLLDVYTEHFADSIPGPVDGAPAMLADLRAAGVRVLGLTNWSAETFPVAHERAPWLRLLEDVLVSGEAGLAKPDPRIFRLAAERFALDIGRTLFVDDVTTNVAGAVSCGYPGETFTGHPALRRRLRTLGVPVPAAPRDPGPGAEPGCPST